MESYIVVRSNHNTIPLHVVKIGNKLRKRLNIKPGDAVELYSSRPMIFWVIPGNGEWDAMINSGVARVLGMGERYMVKLKRVKVSAAEYVELKAHRFVKLSPENLKEIAMSLVHTPLREQGYVIAESTKGIIPFRVEKCYPSYSFIARTTKIIFG
ncbi:MAG TPA: hypothetical protein ENF80_05405 [Thermofilum sp.]|nr:hypothetical protein [Thermofilum sp.]